ncbi:MAG: Asp-tRNA(Asn)/Glu-tRNA(Gln) amidotransferase subunit GatA, partial [Oscillospiraceae bacterium]|nr:Asp-tRNA(Asn)/Glu-tRNA(Gln) amidotransferase subunit GatA [Oscillospiraceae bacterium]
MDITKLKIRDMRTLLDSGEISATELTQGYIDRINKYDGNVKSYITVTEEHALESAKAAQEKIKAGNASPLCGIPMAIKDNISTDGVKTT